MIGVLVLDKERIQIKIRARVRVGVTINVGVGATVAGASVVNSIVGLMLMVICDISKHNALHCESFTLYREST